MEQDQTNGNTVESMQEVVHVDASFEPLIPKFMANRKKEIATMQQALNAQDFSTIQNIGHGMKGAGGSYGFDRITEFGASLERAAKAADLDAIRQEISQLAAYLERVTVVYE